MSKNKIKKREIGGDPLYQDVVVSKFINHIMERGKKSVARKIIYGAFDIIKKESKKDPLKIFESALGNVIPLLEVRPQRVGGAIYQVPREVDRSRGTTLAMRWIIKAARSQKGKPMKEKLAHQLMEAANNTGAAVKRRENTHKMAKANRAFAHFAR